ncbi:MAG: helix-turn-helix transcriptional regulator [Nitrospiraceae bacterium]|jgi:transcriptional regulator with XRE-family HTH domain|nr:helix-turn-helix transcriptional regulator [Nitrospiraceae bacterium]
MADIKKIFGKNVRIYREGSGISQEKLAHLCGLHRTYIGSIERGERNISLENIQKIADALQVKIIDLFEGINAKKNKQ